MNNNNFDRSDGEAVMREIGHLMPSILCESILDGFHKFRQSRSEDSDAYPEYSDCTRANMLYDRIAASARRLIDLITPENPDLHWKITKNKRATDMLLDTRFAFRVKRSKRNRRNLTTGVRTGRQRAIKPNTMVAIGQMMFRFPSNQIEVDDRERTWITVAFDLDDVEESIERIVIGIELQRKFLWQTPLVAADANVLASLPGPVAQEISQMRARRSA